MYQVNINKVDSVSESYGISHVSHIFYLDTSVDVCKLIEKLSSKRYFISLCEITIDSLDDVLKKINEL